VIGFIVCGVIESEDLPAGNPSKLTHMMDYAGGICGVTDGVLDKEYAYFMPSGQAGCVASCPSSTDYEKFICQYDTQDEIDEQEKLIPGISVALYLTNTAQYKCMPHMATVPGPYYACVFDPESADNAEITASMASALGDQTPGEPPETSSFDDFQADLQTGMVLILVFGFIVAAIMGFVALRLIRLPFMLEFIIWGCIGGVFAFCFGIGIMLRYVTAPAWKEEEPPLHTNAEIAGVMGMGYFFLALAALWFCIICCLRKRIFLAIGITKEAAKALGAMTSLILFPVFQTLGIVMFSCVWMVYMLYLASSGDIIRETYEYNGYEFESKSYVYSENTRKAYWYRLFCGS